MSYNGSLSYKPQYYETILNKIPKYNNKTYVMKEYEPKVQNILFIDPRLKGKKFTS